MKKRNVMLTLALSTLVVFSSCKKDDDNTSVNPPFTPPVGNTNNSMAAKFQNYFESQKQVFSVDANMASTITGQKGTSLYFNGANFEDGNGNPVTGNVDITLVENYSKLDMLMTNKVTLASTGSGTEILISGGEFYLEASQNGNLLEVTSPIQVTTAPGNASTIGNMQLFDGTTDADGNIIWALNNDTLNIVQDSAGQVGYGFDWADSLSWINCDYFMSNSGPQTGVEVNVPSVYTNSNTSVFMVFNNDNAITSLNDYGVGVFGTGSWYSVPEGMDVSFVVTSDYNNQIQYAIISNSIITTNHSETLTASDFTTVADMAALESALSAYF